MEEPSTGEVIMMLWDKKYQYNKQNTFKPKTNNGEAAENPIPVDPEVSAWPQALPGQSCT